jgi:hypothetical protein
MKRKFAILAGTAIAVVLIPTLSVTVPNAARSVVSRAIKNANPPTLPGINDGLRHVVRWMRR